MRLGRRRQYPRPGACMLRRGQTSSVERHRQASCASVTESTTGGSVKARGQRRHHRQATTSRHSQSHRAIHTSSPKSKSTPLSYFKVMANINARVIVDVSAEFKVDVISHPSCFRAIRQSQASIVLRHSQRRGPRSRVRSHTLYAIVRGRGRTRNANVAV